jgi:hypothetical protein
MADQQPTADTSPNGTQAPGQQAPPPVEGGNQDESKATVDAKELAQLKVDAGRWRARNGGRDERGRSRDTTSRREREVEITDETLPEEIRKRDQAILERETEIMDFKLKERVRDILSQDAYKAVPAAIKRAVEKNPRGFVRPDSKKLEHLAEDIEDFLAEEIVTPVASAPNTTEQPKPENRPTPPATGSGPGKTGDTELEDLTNLRGPARSQAAFRNSMRKAKRG